ncbi:Cytochrome P450 11B1 [Dirofilaria immitis]
MAQESSSSIGRNLDVFTEDPLLQRLHRTFTVFSNNKRHISLHQAHFIIGQLFRLNHGAEQAQNVSILIRSDAVTFHDLLRMCDLLFPDRKQFEPLVDRIFERYVQHIVCKGFLFYCCKSNKKKRCLMGNNNSKWRTYWCTIMPSSIHLWPLHKSTAVRNRRTIFIDQASSVQVGIFDEERFTWSLITESKQKYEFGHFDELQQKQWIFAMNLAIEQRSVEDLQKHDREYDQKKALHDEEIVRTMLDEERRRCQKLEKKLQNLLKNLDENCNNSLQD